MGSKGPKSSKYTLKQVDNWHILIRFVTKSIKSALLECWQLRDPVLLASAESILTQVQLESHKSIPLVSTSEYILKSGFI